MNTEYILLLFYIDFISRTSYLQYTEVSTDTSKKNFPSYEDPLNLNNIPFCKNCFTYDSHVL